MNPPKNRQNSITRYHLAEENMVGAVQEQTQNYDLMTAIMICLGRPEDAHYTGILKLLDVLLSSETGQETKRQILQDDFDIPMTQTIERTVSLMCNLSKGVEDRGIAKGMAEGIAKGMAEGIAKGMAIGTERAVLEAIRSLMATLKLTAAQAMTALQIPEGEQEKYSSLLNC